MLKFENTSKGFTAHPVVINDELWFNARDVVCSLGYFNGVGLPHIMSKVPSNCNGYVQVLEEDSATSKPMCIFCLSVEGLFFFLNRSNKPDAQSYKLWIEQEVIPQIRIDRSATSKANSSSSVADLYSELLAAKDEVIAAKNEIIAILKENNTLEQSNANKDQMIQKLIAFLTAPQVSSGTTISKAV